MFVREHQFRLKGCGSSFARALLWMGVDPVIHVCAYHLAAVPPFSLDAPIFIPGDSFFYGTCVMRAVKQAFFGRCKFLVDRMF